jgi:cysteine-rich repeat protein
MRRAEVVMGNGVRWFALALAVAGVGAFGAFTGCGGSSPAISGGDGGDDSTVTGDDGPQPQVCGDGVVEPPEQCDLGSANGTGKGCQSDCSWTCTAPDNGPCGSGDPCSGAATCTSQHSCAAGTPEDAGTPCGTGKICRGGVCSPAVCGDGVVTAPEECDDGSKNGAASDGCTATCTFVCLSTDPARDCKATECAGAGTCNDASHTCTAGSSAPDGTPCGGVDGGAPSGDAGTSVCKGGVCVTAGCGDGIVEAPEQCDFGAGNGVGTGCEANCTFSCVLSPTSCVTQDPCGGTNTCTAITVGGSPGQKCELGAPEANGTPCPNGGTCQSALCVTLNCGNGTVDTGEQCDWGKANDVAGSGCEPDCTFSCTTSPNSCPGADPCSASPETCSVVAGPTGTPAGDNGQKCSAGTVLAQCAGCGGANICVANVCKADTCGDSCVVAPETCDPPNGTTCGPNCQAIACGDGVVAGTEQCDDTNTTNLDGCDQYCNFEQEQRATALTMLGATDSYCTKNALGAQALTSTGLSTIQGSLNTDVKSGAIDVMFKFMGNGATPADLSGTTGAVSLGSLGGAPVNADAGAYSGTADLDWWYTVDPNTIDSNRNPLSSLAGTYTSKTLNAGPGLLTLGLILSGSPAKLAMWNVILTAAIGPTNAPTVSTGATPGQLASSHDATGLTSFENAGVGASGGSGELCGNITAQSLQGVAMPATIAKGGADACSANYSVTANSLLDALVGGCKVFGLITAINATQPDQTDPTVTFPAGTTPPYKLTATAGTHVVSGCTDSTKPTAKTVPLATCLAGLAYSGAFKFQTDRVIVK